MIKEAFIYAKSVHIFGWSFLIDRGKSRDQLVPIEKIIGNFKKSLTEWGWIRKRFDILEEEGKIKRDSYMLKQYLSSAAEQIFFESKVKDAICTVYEYPLREKEYFYSIQKGENTYELPIESIELHVYNCGVGILFFKALCFHNYGIDGIKEINDYGRRINVAYIPQSEKDWCIWADKLGIVIKNRTGDVVERSVMNYKEMIAEVIDGNNIRVNMEKMQNPAEFLELTLYGKLGCDNNCSDGREKLYKIQSYSDDRMFLISMIRDSNLSREVKEITKDTNNLIKKNGAKEEQEQKNKKIALEDKIYSICYADPDEATCRDVDMRRELLQKSLYKRWLDYGSLSGVTSYSYVLITSYYSGIDSSVVRPFYYEYLYLISLVLAQRIGIARFSYDTTRSAKIMHMRYRNPFRCLVESRKYLKLQEKFVIFNSQMLVVEPSCQEQGIEIYQMLQKQLLIKEEHKLLGEQLQSMYEAISTWRSNVWTQIGYIGVLVGIINAVLDKDPNVIKLVYEKLLEVFQIILK